MIKKQNCSDSKKYLITPSLLNSWGYIFTCVDSVREAKSDEICLEDKQSLAQEKAYSDFLNTLKRVPSETNIYMQRGIDFENEVCIQKQTPFAEIVEGGQFQAVGKKVVSVGDMNFLMYGRLDVLKAGTIYDIKCVSRYERPKYKSSYQHRFYLDLFPEAKKFIYLICQDGYNGDKEKRQYHQEQYFREDCISTEEVIGQFINWLKTNDLLNLYKEHWVCKY